MRPPPPTDELRPPHAPPAPAPAPASVFVPVLPPGTSPPDAVAIAAWHLAVSNLVGVEVAHDLLAMWVFPERGGVLLLAPTELGADRVDVPAPEPFLHQHDLFDIEQRVREAGYRSVIGVPVRTAERDVGLVLFAALEPGRYGISQAMRLHGVVRELVPSFATIAASPPLPSGEESAGAPSPGEENLLEWTAKVATEATTGPDFLRMLSGVLQAVIPHDAVEVVVPGARPNTWAALGGASRARWSAVGRADTTTDAVSGLDRLGAGEGVLVLDDLQQRGATWPGSHPEGHRVRSLVGVELPLAGGERAWWFLGAAGQGRFRGEDVDTMRRVAPVLALKVQGLRDGLAAEVGQAQLSAQGAAAPRAARLSALLAATEHWGEAARQFERDVTEAFGYGGVRFALRLGEDQVVTLRPGDVGPVRDRSREPLEVSPLAPVIRDEAPFLVHGDAGEHVAVPLRVAGRVSGALECRDGRPGAAGHPVAAIQQLADVIAPHLELLRRASLPPTGSPSPQPSASSTASPSS